MKGDRVAQLELLLKSNPEGLRKSEIARRLGVHRSTVGRYIEELKEFSEVYEDNNQVKIVMKNTDEHLDLSVYESIALNMGAEMLLSNSELQNPHLASGLRKLAMNMQSYAPKIATSMNSIAEEVDKKVTSQENASQFTETMEALIDAWVSGRMVKIFNSQDEETELAPYFIGFAESETGRHPISVTGRLRHTTEIITLDITDIKKVEILNETYTIPDNLKPFRKFENPDSVNNVIDTIKLQLKVKERSALNSFRTLAHSEIETVKQSDGSYLCSFEAENSIELFLRLIQCFDSVEVVGPDKYRAKFVSRLENILSLYK